MYKFSKSYNSMFLSSFFSYTLTFFFNIDIFNFYNSIINNHILLKEIVKIYLRKILEDYKGDDF